MLAQNRNYCCFCIPFRFAVAILSLLALALGGGSLWLILKAGITETSYKIAAYIATGVYGLLGISGLCAVIFKRYALAKNFSILWWTVTVVVSVLSILNIVLLATRGKDEIRGICQANLLAYDDKYHGDTASLAADVDGCYKYWLIGAGVGVFVQVIVMSIGGWVASKYTSEVKHQKEGLGYTYGQGYGPVHPQPQPHLHQQSAAHPYTNLGAKGGW
ncbi:hypothetical protein BGX27_003628 [Mortierella sp. AM989]|nr:hypothetical protein BGX27_003628 [Mortierella sp. AM989]